MHYLFHVNTWTKLARIRQKHRKTATKSANAEPIRQMKGAREMYPKLERLTTSVEVLKVAKTQSIENLLEALVEHVRETYNACLCTLGPDHAITKEAFAQLRKAIIIAERSKGNDK